MTVSGSSRSWEMISNGTRWEPTYFLGTKWQELAGMWGWGEGGRVTTFFTYYYGLNKKFSNGGSFYLPKEMWQHLEIFVVLITGVYH